MGRIVPVIAPTHRELTSLEMVKAEVGVTDSLSDALIVDWIMQSTDYIENYTGRRFAKQQVDEYVIGDGTKSLLLSIRPVLTIDSVTDRTVVVPTTDYWIEDAEAGIVRNETGWPDNRRYGYWLVPTPVVGRTDTVVRYTGGYVLPNDNSAGPRTLPYDIEWACRELVKLRLLRRNTDPFIQRERIGESEVEYFDQITRSGLPPDIYVVLDAYKIGM